MTTTLSEYQLMERQTKALESIAEQLKRLTDEVIDGVRTYEQNDHRTQ